VVKCTHGCLLPPSLLENFKQLKKLSIVNVGVSSLVDFPRLPHIKKLILSDNRINGGLYFLVEAGLESLRDLDLSNNKIQYIDDLAPLAQLKFVSLDLYKCPVTRVVDYRAKVFDMIKYLKYLDKAVDAEDNERSESDEDEDDQEEEDDGGSGEIDAARSTAGSWMQGYQRRMNMGTKARRMRKKAPVGFVQIVNNSKTTGGKEGRDDKS
jgi:hypothetical protein